MQITLRDPATKWGWNIETRADLLTALMGYSAFDTVYSEFIEEAIDQAAEERTEYENIEDLAKTLLANYI